MSADAPRRLAICADDYGMAEAVDDAVLTLARQGRISATSCMVGAPHWRTGARALRLVDPRSIDVGLHLDLTEYPQDARLRHPLHQWLARSHLGLVSRAALRREIDSQLDAFELAMGRAPSHVDGHEHVHQFPVVRSELLAALDARYGDRRPWLRRTRRPSNVRAGSKAWLIEALGSGGLARLADAKGYGQNGHLLGVYDFQGDAPRYLALLGQRLAAAQHGDLLVCHPATGPVRGDAIAAARVCEYQVLAGPGFGALLARESIRVGPLLETMRS